MAIVNKLVRDKIINIIEKKGRKPVYKILDDIEFKDELQKKLIEECNEYLISNNPNELADILEITLKLAQIHNINKTELENLRIQKDSNSGGFDQKLFLIDNDDNSYISD